MCLQCPSTLLTAWLLAPALVALAAAGLGGGIAVGAGSRLGALTLPTGYLAGMLAGAALLELGLSGTATVVALALLAAAGAVAWVLRARRAEGGMRRPARAALLAAAVAVAVYLVALAPLAGSGRSGVLGYAMNNDSVNHISAVELLRESGTDTSDAGRDSFSSIKTTTFQLGYPLGSHVWPLFASKAAGIDPFHTWTPLIAVTLAMIALAAACVLRRVGAGEWVAPGGGALVALGYLPYSFAAQGAAKELALSLAVYACVALFALGASWAAGWRTLVPGFVAAASALAIFGPGALVWLALPALVGAAVAVARHHRLLSASGLGRWLPAALVGALLALPLAVASVRFSQNTQGFLKDPLAVGNLLARLRWWETFNVWLAYDYRFRDPDFPLPTVALVALAVALAAIGLWHVLRTRAAAPAAILLAAGSGFLYLALADYSLYYQVKSYPLLALALGTAAVTGAVALLKARRGWVRGAGLAAAGVLALGVLASDAMVYAGAWVTPKDRFEQLARIDRRFAGQGPMLVNDREQYTVYLLRHASSWDTWGERQPNRGWRFGPHALPLPRVPDWDDYAFHFIDKFPLLIERRRPGGSRPPENYRVAYGTRDYLVWKRSGPYAGVHISVGAAGISGTARLNCGRTKHSRLSNIFRRPGARLATVREVFDRAARRHAPVRVAYGAQQPVLAIPAGLWKDFIPTYLPAPGPLLARRGGRAGRRITVAPGRYQVFLQGMFGPGVRVLVDGRVVGEVKNDLSLISAWHPVGVVAVGRRPLVVMTGIGRPWWQSGSKRFDVSGRLVFQPLPEGRRIVSVPAREAARRLCGQRLDWIEVPGGRRRAS